MQRSTAITVKLLDGNNHPKVFIYLFFLNIINITLGDDPSQFQFWI